jgi:hypothetical protein
VSPIYNSVRKYDMLIVKPRNPTRVDLGARLSRASSNGWRRGMTRISGCSSPIQSRHVQTYYPRRLEKARNTQEAPALGSSWPIQMLHDRRRLDPDFIISGILRATAMRFYSNWHLANKESRVQRELLRSFQMATAALGGRYAHAVVPIVLASAALQTVGEALGYENRSAAVAAALERLDVGLGRLATFYGLLAP